MAADCGTILPDDIVLEILSGLGSARSIARCRCVCKAWRALVDNHRLLLLPGRDAFFPGFFANTACSGDPAGPLFLPPPSTRPDPAPEVDKLDFLRPHLPLSSPRAAVRDHCNGLLLCFHQGEGAGLVCNPATRRWARLPRAPAAFPRDREGLFLAFDPAVSPHYQVFLLPATSAPQLLIRRAVILLGTIVRGVGADQLDRFLVMKKDRDEKAVPVLVFSSEDGRWTRRVFAAAGGRRSPGHLYDRAMGMALDQWARKTWRCAAYRRGSLYVQCESRVLVALRCSEGTYDMVELPGGAAIGLASTLPGQDSIFLSPDADPETGVLRYASVHRCRVRVWTLREPEDRGQPLEWTLTHDKDLEPHVYVLAIQHLVCGLRLPQGHGQGAHGYSWDEAMDDRAGGALELEPDEERLHALGYRPGFTPWTGSMAILGFHPTREVIFFVATVSRSSLVVAYDLASSKARYLGDVALLKRRVEGVFPYRPCFVDALPLPRS